MTPTRTLFGLFAVILSGNVLAAPVSSSAASSAVSSSAAPTSSSSASSAAASSVSSTSSAAISSASSSSPSSSAASSTSSANAPAWTVPAGWKVASNPCIAEGTSGRALSYTSFTSSAMTIESCLAFCEGNGQPLAGLEFSGECYCGGILGNGASLSASGTCSMSCSGDSGRKCGGPGSLSLFVSTGSSASGLSSDYQSQSMTLPGSWTASGCIAEGKTGRALDGWSYTGSLNIQTCLNYCQNKGFALAGLENGNECWCDNALRNGAGASSTACKTPCNGGPGQICGGPNALTLFTNPAATITTSNGYTKQACLQEVSGRALVGASFMSDSMTVASCTSFCSGKGMKYAGLEYGRECYCGNDLVNGASLSSYSNQCVTKCPGKTSQNCGGPNAIALYASS